MKHYLDTQPSSIHQFCFISETDPALVSTNQVSAYKAWFQVSTRLLRYRNAGNTTWVIVGGGN